MSNISAGETADNPSNQNPEGTAGNSPEPASSSACHDPLCTCEYYVEETEETSHFATFPPELVERCIKAGCPPGMPILDPFGGSGTTALVADAYGFDSTLIELNPAYVDLARRRLAAGLVMMDQPARPAPPIEDERQRSLL